MPVESIFLFYSLAHVLLLIWGALLVRRYYHFTWVFIVLMEFALIYDNTILGLGNTLGDGATLEFLSRGRFVLHALLTPTFIIVALKMLQLTDRKWRDSPWFIRVSVGLTVVLSIFWTVVHFLVPLTTSTDGGSLRYTGDKDKGPMWMIITNPAITFTVIVFLIVAGGFAWRKKGWPWLLVGSVIMFIFGAGSPGLPNALLVGNVGEIALMGGLFLTVRAIGQQKWDA